jgi:hypothetical protein
MTFGVLADIHGNFEAMRTAMTRHPDVPFWLCVGDVASRAGAYPEPPTPLHWIKGNNEDFGRIAAFEAGTLTIPNLHYLPNGRAASVGPLTVAALGGTYAPTWFDLAPSDLPYPGHVPPAAAARARSRIADDKRRHFVRAEVEALARLKNVDVLLTHEAPRPFLVDAERSTRARRHDAGKTPINQVLAAMQPRLHLCGHHHRFSAGIRQGVPSVCVDRVSRSYLLVDAATLEWRKVDVPQAA